MLFEKQQITWHDADRQCMWYMGRLASLNTPDDWNQVVNVMGHFILSKSQFYIGLHVASRDKPSL